MAAPQSSHQSWRIEADTYPQMKFEEYRRLLIHETPQIREFLRESRGEHFVISAPKGFGKTLLLIAKRKQVEENRGYQLPDASEDEQLQAALVGATGGGEIVDRPRGNLPALSRSRIDQMRNDYYFWKNIWWISIMIAALKLDARSNKRDLVSEVAECDKWIKDIILNKQHYNTPTIIFTSLIETDYSTQLRVIKSARNLNHLFDAIRTQIAFFIDNVDEYFKPLLEDRAVDASAQNESYYRTKSNDIWTVAQLALAGTAYEIHKANSHIKVYCTIRREAFIRLDEYDTEYSQIVACTVEIDYSRDDFKEIFTKNVRLTSPEDLAVPNASDPMLALFGPSYKDLKHRFVDQAESAFDFVLRHTFYRPRDLMMIGQAIAALAPQDRSADRIRDAVDRTTDDLVKGLLSEMRPFFHLPNLRKLLSHVKTNVLTIDEMDSITKSYLSDVPPPEGDDGNGIKEYRHPFCILQKIGMLGWIQTEYSKEQKTRQRFVKPREIAMRNHIGLPVTEGFYLVHPALDHLASQEVGGQYLRNFQRANIIGNDAPWTEPASSMFVVIGDMCGFSEVMGSELYRAIARKVDEWAEAACQELDFFQVSGGDSVLMIDKSADRIVRSAAEMSRRASSYREHSISFRFGGAAGPITFQDFRRRVNGAWDAVMFPLGLSLRTAARLEPHSPKGSLLVDDQFVRLANNGVKEFGIRELDSTGIKNLKFDPAKKVFLVQKNPNDSPIETKLYEVTLSEIAETHPVDIPSTS